MISAIDGVLRVECFVRVEGYRGDGLWGKGMGELGRVLGRWFGSETVGNGSMRFWRQGL
ncbi:hypothetical protein Tco_0659978, partial [Tanacetum coccineum]